MSRQKFRENVAGCDIMLWSFAPSPMHVGLYSLQVPSALERIGSVDIDKNPSLETNSPLLYYLMNALITNALPNCRQS